MFIYTLNSIEKINVTIQKYIMKEFLSVSKSLIHHRLDSNNTSQILRKKSNKNKQLSELH